MHKPKGQRREDAVDWNSTDVGVVHDWSEDPDENDETNEDVRNSPPRDNQR